jgi:hypothetical protein
MNAPTGIEVDHRNHNGLDNRRSNLRLATGHQNQGNRRPQGGSPRFKGVYLSRSKWVAQIRFGGSKRYLGRFTVEEDAARAYDAAARLIFGEFACTNFNLAK